QGPVEGGPVLPERWRRPEWCDLSAGRAPGGSVRIGTAFIKAAYAEGNPNYPASNWYLTPETNDYRLGLLDGWLSVLREHYGLSLLQLPAGVLVGGHGWDLARARRAVLNLAGKHGTSVLVGFDHAVSEHPEGLEDDWPHQHGLLARPE